MPAKAAKVATGVWLFSTGLWVPATFLSVVIGLPLLAIKKTVDHFKSTNTDNDQDQNPSNAQSQQWTLNNIMEYLQEDYNSLLEKINSNYIQEECAVCFETKEYNIVCTNGHTSLCTDCDFRAMCVGLLERYKFNVQCGYVPLNRDAIIIKQFWSEHISLVHYNCDIL